MGFFAANDDVARQRAFSGLHDGMGGAPDGWRALICVDEDKGEYEVEELFYCPIEAPEYGGVDPEEFAPYISTPGRIVTVG